MPLPPKAANLLIPILLTFQALAVQIQRLDLAWQSIPASLPSAWPDENLWSNPASAWLRDGKRIPASGPDSPTNLWLRTTFTLPDGWERDRLQLDFYRMDSYGIVYLNGRRAGELTSPSAKINATGLLHPGTNTLQIFGTRDYTGLTITPATDPLRDGSRGQRSDRPFAWHQWPLPAVSGPVELIRLPRPAALVDAFFKPSVWTGRLTLEVDLDADETAPSDPAKPFRLNCSIYDEHRHLAKQFPTTQLTLKKGTQTVELTQPWPDAKHWELDRPYLYTAHLTLHHPDGTLLDTRLIRFGFREVWTEGKNIILNGHIQRFRLEGGWFGLTTNSLRLFKALGRNMLLIQPHPNKWWYFGWWHDCPLPEETLLDLCDQEGIAVQEAVPTVCRAVNVFDDPTFKTAYCKETETWIRRLRNHPSLLLWAVSMNFVNPKDSIHPDQLGQRRAPEGPRQTICQWAIEQVKRIDPTRLVYTHADGNIGDISSGNCYPNITPVQEIRDYLEYWRKAGNMPYLASEYDAVYDGTYLKAGGYPALAEIYAINKGPEAYDLLSEAVATNYFGFKGGVAHGGSGLKDFVGKDPVYWGIQGLYVEATDRCWRMDGAAGWHYFHGANYGHALGARNYADMAPYCGHEDWISPNFALHSRNMQDLLLFLSGAGRASDRTHTFWSGGEAKGAVNVVWDGSRRRQLAVDVHLFEGSNRLARVCGTRVDLSPGEVRQVAFSFRGPKVRARTDYRLELSWRDCAERHSKAVVADGFDLTVFPDARRPLPGKAPGLELPCRVRLFDPKGRSQWVRGLVGKIAAEDADSLRRDPPKAGELLVVGREALEVGGRLPWTPEQLRRGLKVLVLEQRPELFEAWGFNCFEFMPRALFRGAEVATSLMKGLLPPDLTYWRDSPDLLPTFRLARAHDFSQHPKGSNRHAMASTVFAQPTVPGFLPLLVCEMDLAYSPLLRYADGKGAIYFSSIDLTDRADGSEPAATLFAANLLEFAAREPVDASCRVKVNYGTRAPDTDAFIAQGGRVLNVGFDAAELAACGLRSKPAVALRPRPDGELARFADRRLLYFRAPLHYTAIDEPGAATQGIWYRRGNEAFLQPIASGFIGPCAEPKVAGNLTWSKAHLDDLVARARTWLGEQPSEPLRREMATIERKPSFQPLNIWHVIGPYQVNPSLDTTQRLAVVHSPEKAALAGDLNPNYTYPNECGEPLDFRTSAEATPDGFVDLRRYLKGPMDECSVAYAVKTIAAPRPRRALLRLGFDWYLKVYLNGRLVADWSAGLGCSPRANMKACILDLKPGENILTLKQRAGAGGFGFWANLSEEGLDISGWKEGQLAVETENPLYGKGRGTGWEYFYTYW